MGRGGRRATRCKWETPVEVKEKAASASSVALRVSDASDHVDIGRSETALSSAALIRLAYRRHNLTLRKDVQWEE